MTREIAELVPKLNLVGDAVIDAFAAEMLALTRYTPDALRADAATKSEAVIKADEMARRLSGYKL